MVLLSGSIVIVTMCIIFYEPCERLVFCCGQFIMGTIIKRVNWVFMYLIDVVWRYSVTCLFSIQHFVKYFVKRLEVFGGKVEFWFGLCVSKLWKFGILFLCLGEFIFYIILHSKLYTSCKLCNLCDLCGQAFAICLWYDY